MAVYNCSCRQEQIIIWENSGSLCLGRNSETYCYRETEQLPEDGDLLFRQVEKLGMKKSAVQPMENEVDDSDDLYMHARSTKKPSWELCIP